jgi:hypothetical protein
MAGGTTDAATEGLVTREVLIIRDGALTRWPRTQVRVRAGYWVRAPPHNRSRPRKTPPSAASAGGVCPWRAEWRGRA